MIKLILTGRPISVNHLYRSAVSKGGRPFTYMTDLGRTAKWAWQLEAKTQMRQQGRYVRDKDNLEVNIVFTFENKMRRDVDNYLKALFDCLSGTVWVDDKQIMKLTVEKRYAKKGEPPKTELEIFEVQSGIKS